MVAKEAFEICPLAIIKNGYNFYLGNQERVFVFDKAFDGYAFINDFRFDGASA